MERKPRGIRLNDTEWARFKNLLGAEWLRTQIKKAADRAAKQTKGTDQ